jgi:hypothetical protein
MVIATFIALATLVGIRPRPVTHMVGRPTPEGVASRRVGSPMLVGATALGLVALTVRFGHRAALGSALVVHGVGHLPAGHVVALVLPGLTDPLLIGV